MIRLRVGTRGSELALWQTRWVVERLRHAHPSIRVEAVIIKTHGDAAPDQKIDSDWPVGGFVGAIEEALSAERIDFAVHSYKDLPTQVTPGLTIAAVPPRELVNDALVTRSALDLDHVPSGFKLGTSSQRRAAQFRRVCQDVVIVPVRGNVPTRIAKIEREGLDGVVLAAAGLKRLNIHPPHQIDLPTDRFVPSPAQGALAVQARAKSPAEELLAILDDSAARRAVNAERSFLRTIAAGCHTPVGALATADGTRISLRGQLFDDEGRRMVEGVEAGNDPESVGLRLGRRLLGELKERS